MPQPALNIIGRALQRARVGNVISGTPVGFATQALQELNSLLDYIAQTIDFSAAMDTYYFTFNPNLISLGGANIIQASPNLMPLDYLRVQTAGGATGAQRTTKWYLDGVPYDLVEIDLTEWDDQVQQAGIQSYPYFAAKDMSQRQILINATGDLSTASTTVSDLQINGASSVSGIVAGMSISGGLGPTRLISPGTTITAVGAGPPYTLTLSTLPSLKQVNSLDPSFAYTQTGASLMIGFPPVLLIYPPPSGAFNAMVRYQQLPPPLTMTQVTAGAMCWFDDDAALIDGLTGKLMEISDDARSTEFIGPNGLRVGDGGGKFGQHMSAYIKTADDRSNRAQAVQLDRRSFGKSFSTLRSTKTVGWQLLVALMPAIGALFC